MAQGWRTDLRDELQALDADPQACGGELLESFEYGAVGEALAAWVDQQRQAWRVQRLVTIERAARSHRAQGRYDLGVAYAQRLVALEPLHESLHRLLIALHYLRGDCAAAVAVYDACEQVLRRELHMTPEERTLALLRAAPSQDVGAGVDLRR